MIDTELLEMHRRLDDAGVTHDNMSMAVHEVGHAIVAREGGLTPEKLVIRKFWGGGYCDLKPDGVQGDDQARGLLECYMAGIEAQNLWATKMQLPAVHGTDIYDVQMFDNFCEQHHFEYTQAEARGAAVAILSSETTWRELEEMALELAGSGVMTL